MSRRPPDRRRDPDDLKVALEHFLNEARLNLFPKLKATSLVIPVVDGHINARLALELGASLLLDKPILLVVLKGTVVPPRLRMVVDEWIEVDDIRDPAGQAKLASAIERTLARKPAKPVGE